jgi:hypothetical protein
MILIAHRQRWASALFSHIRARDREAKKEPNSAKKKECEKSESAECKKSESAERERKKCKFALFLPPQWNPVSDPKAARQVESKGLDKYVQFSRYVKET